VILAIPEGICIIYPHSYTHKWPSPSGPGKALTEHCRKHGLKEASNSLKFDKSGGLERRQLHVYCRNSDGCVGGDFGRRFLVGRSVPF
jgi:hypothetical protein